MNQRFAHAVLRRFTRPWLASWGQSWRNLPLPKDAPLAHAAGANADQVLLVGSGLAVSFGVFSHDLGLAGNLARRLTRLTGRGTTVAVRAKPEFTVDDALTVVSSTDMSRFGAIVVTLGGLESITFQSVSSWASDVERLIVTAQRTAPNALLHFVGIAHAPKTVTIARLYVRQLEAHINEMNSATRAMCARFANSNFIPFEVSQSLSMEDFGRRRYQAWAELIATPIADGLDLHPDVDAFTFDEHLRQEAVDRTGLVGADPDNELEQVVATARDLFGASGAGLNIIDHTRQWVMAAAGMGREDVPREESICSRTIASADLLIVEDTHQNTEYSSRAWAHGDDPIRFYAGHPIEAPDGHRIGALCVVDNKPRTFSETDRALLRELAMRVQGLLWEKSRLLSRPA